MWPALQGFRLRDAIDILLVAVVLYRVFVMFKETRAVQMLLGLGALMAASFLAHRFELYGSSWILDNFWSFWVLALIVLFQPLLGHGYSVDSVSCYGRVAALTSLLHPEAK